MQVLINNHQIDFSLEKEETAREIIESIDKWSSERSLILMEARIDDEIYRPDDIPDKSLDSIDIIDCTVQSKADVVFTTIDEGISYCNRVLEYIETEDFNEDKAKEELKSIADGVEWLVDVLNSIATLIDVDYSNLKIKDRTFVDFINSFNSLKENVLKLNGSNTDVSASISEITDLFSLMKEGFQVILFNDKMKSLVIQSIDSPDILVRSLVTIKSSLPEHIDKVQEAAVAFQSGKDDIGLERLNEFTEFIYLYTRTCYQISPVFELDLNTVIVDEVSLSDRNAELTSLLTEISEVMEAGDIISLADILEYEILPSMEALSHYIDQLFEKLGVDK